MTPVFAAGLAFHYDYHPQAHHLNSQKCCKNFAAAFPTHSMCLTPHHQLCVAHSCILQHGIYSSMAAGLATRLCALYGYRHDTILSLDAMSQMLHVTLQSLHVQFYAHAEYGSCLGGLLRTRYILWTQIQPHFHRDCPAGP